ncbi:MAG: hypothetical protein FJX23_10685 [Alphaproteobacteria bacterium]|nr:hypothetical protein [Alphaproteobacteria bacterium]
MFQVTEQKTTVANPAALGLHSTYIDNVSSRMSNSEYTHKSASAPEVVSIESRFGAVKVDKAKAILFPIGILGMPDKHNFALTDFPNPKLQQFKLLQSLDENELSFITLPLELENGIIEREDIVAAAQDMEIPVEQLGIVLIVSVHRGLSDVQLSVNARAPIFIDTSRQIAAQYVFTSSKYAVQHFITGDKSAQTNHA